MSKRIKMLVMGNKKEIGTYFRDQLTEKEIRPTDEVWTTIEATLKKKRRKRFLIWLFLLSALSLVGIFIFLQITSVNTTKIANDPIKNTNQTSPLSEENKSDVPIKTKKKVDRIKDSIAEQTRHLEIKDSLRLKAPSSSQQIHVNTLTTDSATSTQQQETLKRSEHKTESTTVHTPKEISSTSPSAPKSKNRQTSKKRKTTAVTDTAATPIDQKQSKEVVSELEQQLENKKEKQKNNSTHSKTGGLLSQVIQKAKDTTITKDTLITKPRKKEGEEDEEKEIPKLLPGNWTVSIHAAPVFHGYLSNTNALLIDDNIPISHKPSLGYGILMNIPLNDKVLLRFGFNKLDFNYSYENITSGINLNARPDIFNPETTVLFTSSLNQNLRNDIDAGLAFDIEHKISYWEIPLEVVHALKGKKARLDIIGGLDVYVFRDDAINLNVPNRGTFNIGTANYFKKQALGAHIGIGFRYPITKSIQFDVEPTFKYLFSSFKRDTQNLNPYYFGIYTGFTFKL